MIIFERAGEQMVKTDEKTGDCSVRNNVRFNFTQRREVTMQKCNNAVLSSLAMGISCHAERSEAKRSREL